MTLARKSLGHALNAGASLASTLQIAPQRAVHATGAGPRFGALVEQRQQWSAFLWPIVLRSMCLREVVFAVPECPRFGETFVRNLHVWLPASESAARATLPPRARRSVGSAWAYRMLRSRGLNATASSAVLGGAWAHPCEALRTPAECSAAWHAALQ